MGSEIKEIQVAGKRVELFGSPKIGAPLVLYHAFEGEGAAIYEACEKLDCPSFTFASINGLDWEEEATPWAAGPIFKKGGIFAGGADAYLHKLEKEIVPAIKEKLGYPIDKIIIAGYSLGGLLALYAGYRSSLFFGIVSSSGSLWYPKFWDFVRANHLSPEVKSVYFSVGDKESQTKNPYLSTVQITTREIEKKIAAEGVATTFELNPGNHYQDSNLRTAKGIKWILEASLVG